MANLPPHTRHRPRGFRVGPASHAGHLLADPVRVDTTEVRVSDVKQSTEQGLVQPVPRVKDLTRPRGRREDSGVHAVPGR